jgi:RNA polymerase sigma-70 factor (ECF subfamily)
MSEDPAEVTPARFDVDAELAAATAAGDADAFERLVRKYERPVLSTIYRYVGDRAGAEDVAQEVFLKVWRRAKSFQGKSSFSTWLYRVVVNECLTFRRRRARTRNVPLDESLVADGPGLEESLDGAKKAAAVRAAVDELPGRQRMALILAKFEGRSYREIAEIMKVSTSSVESLIFRARQALKEKLVPMRRRGEI